MPRKTFMTRKMLYIAQVLVILMLVLPGCGSKEEEVNLAGKIYTYTGESFSGLESDRFTITINEDGTFSYYESMLSSYVGSGTWSEEDGMLTLSESEDMGCYPFVNYFRIDGEDLVFIAEGSSNFIYIDVKDGERFTGAAN